MIGHVAGLDIGSTKVSCLIADVDADGRAHLVGYGKEPCKGVKKGSVIDMDETTRSIERAVKSAEQMCDRQVDAVTVGISGEHISMQQGTGRLTLTPSSREITPDDVRRVVDNSRSIAIPPDQEILDVIPRSYRVDGRNGVTHPVGIYGSRLEVSTQIVVGGSTAIQNIARAVEKAGLEVHEMALEPLAASRAVLEDSERDVGVAMIDLGGESGDVSVFQGGVVQYYGTVPVGSRHVTSDISKLLRTSLDEAERLKLEHGTVEYEEIGQDESVEVRQLGNIESRRFPRRMLAEIVQSRMWEMLQMARRHLENSGHLTLLPGGVVLVGGGSKMVGMAKLAGEMLNRLPVRIGIPKGIDGLDDITRAPECATAVGLVQSASKALLLEESGEPRGDWLRTLRRKWFTR